MESISVSVRLRPLSKSEATDGAQSAWRIDGNSLVPKEATASGTRYSLDHVFGPDWTTKAVYAATTHALIEKVMSGFNSTVFAYGQTSSGKTYSMRGTDQDLGIIPLAVTEVFELMVARGEREFLMRVTYMELYNEDANDLLEPNNKKLTIREEKDGGVKVVGLKEVQVNDAAHVLRLLDAGEAQRHVGSTKMNEQSSRSHTIFRMVIESRLKDADEATSAAVRVSTLTLVDLAGSERVAKTGAEGMRMKEGTAINKSLFTLGNVINKLSEGALTNGGHIPYRDSKLTRILQPSLGGNAKTAILCAMTPAACHQEESHSTLRFACRAKQVVNNAHVNEVVSDAAMLKRQAKEIADLKQKLGAVPGSEVKSVREQLLLKEEELRLKEQELMRKEHEMELMREEFAAMQADKDDRANAQQQEEAAGWDEGGARDSHECSGGGGGGVEAEGVVDDASADASSRSPLSPGRDGPSGECAAVELRACQSAAGQSPAQLSADVDFAGDGSPRASCASWSSSTPSSPSFETDEPSSPASDVDNDRNWSPAQATQRKAVRGNRWRQHAPTAAASGTALAAAFATARAAASPAVRLAAAPAAPLPAAPVAAAIMSAAAAPATAPSAGGAPTAPPSAAPAAAASAAQVTIPAAATAPVAAAPDPSAAPGSAVRAVSSADEAAALVEFNRLRRHPVPKFTIPVLQDYLKGKKMLSGEKWALTRKLAGKSRWWHKARAELVFDLCEVFQVQALAAAKAAAVAVAAAAAAAEPLSISKTTGAAAEAASGPSHASSPAGAQLQHAVSGEAAASAAAAPVLLGVCSDDATFASHAASVHHSSSSAGSGFLIRHSSDEASETPLPPGGAPLQPPWTQAADLLQPPLPLQPPVPLAADPASRPTSQTGRSDGSRGVPASSPTSCPASGPTSSPSSGGEMCDLTGLSDRSSGSDRDDEWGGEVASEWECAVPTTRDRRKVDVHRDPLYLGPVAQEEQQQEQERNGAAARPPTVLRVLADISNCGGGGARGGRLLPAKGDGLAARGGAGTGGGVGSKSSWK